MRELASTNGRFPASEFSVRRLFCLLLVLSTFASARDGSFTGQVVNGPNLDANKKWVYVQSPKGAVRRVEISAAQVSYDPAVNAKDRQAKAADSVHEGAEVRVTASLDSEGEWKASRIEILKTAPN
jgi:hypothetical protein